MRDNSEVLISRQVRKDTGSFEPKPISYLTVHDIHDTQIFARYYKT